MVKRWEYVGNYGSYETALQLLPVISILLPCIIHLMKVLFINKEDLIATRLTPMLKINLSYVRFV